MSHQAVITFTSHALEYFICRKSTPTTDRRGALTVS